MSSPKFFQCFQWFGWDGAVVYSCNLRGKSRRVSESWVAYMYARAYQGPPGPHPGLFKTRVMGGHASTWVYGRFGYIPQWVIWLTWVYASMGIYARANVRPH